MKIKFNKNQKTIAIVFVVMFVCMYPFFVGTYGTHVGPFYKSNWEWSKRIIPEKILGIEVIILPIVVWFMMLCMVLYFLRKEEDHVSM